MAIRPRWLASLETLLGAHRCETHTTPLRQYAVDGLIPSAVLWPETVEQVATVLQWAERERLAVVPYGSGTKIALGGIPKRLDIVLSTRRLAQVSEYDTANFTLTAGAGITFAQLTQLTAAHFQMLPLQYPFSTATLGGLIATNAYTPKRLRYGGVRDILLGLRVALPSGEVAHFGGRVVKNVAGYDMCKLFLGSFGALGIIVEATFKLSALPERDETLLAVFPSLEAGAATVAQLMAMQLLPSQVLLLNLIATQTIAPQVATSAVAGAALLLVNCEGMEEAVERQLTDLERICQGHGASEVQALAGHAQLQLRTRLAAAMQPHEVVTSSLAALPSARGSEGGGGRALTIRLGTLPSQVHAIMEAAAKALKPLTSGAMIIGDCGVGLVKLCVGLESLDASAIDAPLVGVLRELSGLVMGYGGHVVVENAPPEVKTQIEVWGPPPASFALLKALKRKFDPKDVLSPGRFIGGL
jgi:glycolate oxidase FAD binding subunit